MRWCLLALSVFLHVGCGRTDEVGADCPPLPNLGEQPISNWLAQGCYLGWSAESEVLRATLFDTHVQIFINPDLTESLKRGHTNHPVNAAAVRVMYQPDKVTMLGYSMAIKVAESGHDRWFWFESLDASRPPRTMGVNAVAYTGCHTRGVDFVHSSWPLR